MTVRGHFLPVPINIENLGKMDRVLEKFNIPQLTKILKISA